VQHPYITALPALNSVTYSDVIKQELKAIKKLEKELKELEYLKFNISLKLFFSIASAIVLIFFYDFKYFI